MFFAQPVSLTFILCFASTLRAVEFGLVIWQELLAKNARKIENAKSIKTMEVYKQCE